MQPEDIPRAAPLVVGIYGQENENKRWLMSWRLTASTCDWSATPRCSARSI